MSKTIYKCLECGGTFEHFKYRYDSSPRGDDETVCPCCGAVEPRTTWMTEEEANNYGNSEEND